MPDCRLAARHRTAGEGRLLRNTRPIGKLLFATLSIKSFDNKHGSVLTRMGEHCLKPGKKFVRKRLMSDKNWRHHKNFERLTVVTGDTGQGSL